MSVLFASDATLRDTFSRSWINGASQFYAGNEIDSVDPATGSVFGFFVDCGKQGVDDAVAAASQAFNKTWGQWSVDDRSKRLIAWADLIVKAKDELAYLEGLEVGRPVSDALAINVMGPYVIQECARMAGETTQRAENSVRRPRGVIAAITPWNAPVMNVLLRAVPALAAGNTVVLKPSEISPRSAVFLAQLATQAGIPDGAFNVVVGSGPMCGGPLVAHDGVSMVSFTGSTQTGRSIARTAADTLKPVALECGGKSPQIVLPDMIDDSELWGGVFKAAFWNTGQWCAAKSRLLVPAGTIDRAVAGLSAAAAFVRIGRPEDPATTMGPIASSAQYAKVEDYREKARAVCEVVRLPCIEGDLDANGFWVTPEVAIRPPQDSAIVQEEIFGPLLTIQEYADLDEAVRLANDTPFGLAGSLWTANRSLAERIAAKLEVGLLSVLMTPTANPLFGGGGAFEPRKQSGYGVEGGPSTLTLYTAPQAISFR